MECNSQLQLNKLNMANFDNILPMATQASRSTLNQLLLPLTLRWLVPTLLQAPRRRRRLIMLLIAPQLTTTGKLQVRIIPDILRVTKGW